MSLGPKLFHHFREMIPATKMEQRYITVNLISCVGDGLFVGGTAVYATRVVGLSPHELGLALSATGVAGLVAAGTLGVVADRFGARRTLILLCLLQAAGCLLYLVTGSFAAFTAVASFVAVVEFGQGPARAALVSAIVDGQARVRLRAQSRALTNLGFALGAGMSAVSLTIGTLPAYYMLPIGDAAAYLVVAFVARRLPELRSAAADGGGRSFTALRTLPFMLTTAHQGLLSVHTSLLLVVMPIWIVERTSAPHGLIGAAVVLNTIVVVLFQVRVSRGADSLPGSIRKCRHAAIALLAACVVLGLSGGLPPAAAVALVIAGCVLLTAGEMLQIAGSFGMAYELAPRHAQAEYLGGIEMSQGGQAIVGPAACTWLVLELGLAGWSALGLVLVAAAVTLGPVARWTARVLAARHPDQVPRGDAADRTAVPG